MKPRLYLASTSPYRQALLARLGLPFETEAPGTDEGPMAGEAPAMRALRLARAKADAVAARHPGDWVLGSDQVADCAGSLLGKPGDAIRCREQLALCSGRAVEFHTAAVLLRRKPSAVIQHVDRTIVRFRHLEAGEIARYVDRDRPFDCAGSFRCESLGVTLFEAVETTDPAALIGLPLIWVAGALRDVGLDALAPAQS